MFPEDFSAVSKVRTLEEHNSFKGQFLIAQFPMISRFFAAAGEEDQQQYIRMLASGVKSVAGDAYNIGVKAAAVERAIASIGMNEEMISLGAMKSSFFFCDK
ncbi:hypothetical protein N9O24_00770 [bacterium]|nr:hypothetical protein [bacterium]